MSSVLRFVKSALNISIWLSAYAVFAISAVFDSFLDILRERSRMGVEFAKYQG
jgi:hypothetical protein